MNLSEFKQEFQPKVLLPSLTAGLIAAIVTISMEISLAGGIGLMLFGAFVIGIVTALLASLPGAISVPHLRINRRVDRLEHETSGAKRGIRHRGRSHCCHIDRHRRSLPGSKPVGSRATFPIRSLADSSRAPPGALVIATALFYGYLLLSGISVAEASSHETCSLRTLPQTFSPSMPLRVRSPVCSSMG